MKLFFCFVFLSMVAAAADYPPIKVRQGSLGNANGARYQIGATIDSYKDQLMSIRAELQTSDERDSPEGKGVIESSVDALEELIDSGKANEVQKLLPLVDWINGDQSQTAYDLRGSGAQGTLNYVIDGIFTARMLGMPRAVDDQEMEAMIRFYAGNPAQTSETSWKAPNTMLFAFGTRLVKVLAETSPNRIEAFYTAVSDARNDAMRGPGPDEEEIPESERPSSDRLRSYEDAFNMLKSLATDGVLPGAESTDGAAHPDTGNLRQAEAVDSSVQQVEPTKIPETEPVAESGEAEKSPLPSWLLIVGVVAVLGILLLILRAFLRSRAS